MNIGASLEPLTPWDQVRLPPLSGVPAVVRSGDFVRSTTLYKRELVRYTAAALSLQHAPAYFDVLEGVQTEVDCTVKVYANNTVIEELACRANEPALLHTPLLMGAFPWVVIQLEFGSPVEHYSLVGGFMPKTYVDKYLEQPAAFTVREHCRKHAVRYDFASLAPVYADCLQQACSCLRQRRRPQN